MDPFRRVGLMGWDNSDDERTMWAYSLFGTGWTFWNNGAGTSAGGAGSNTTYNTEGNDNRFGTVIGNSGGIAVAGRMTHLLYYDPESNNRYLTHIGGGYVFGEIGGNSSSLGTNARTFRRRQFRNSSSATRRGLGATAAGTPNVINTGRFLANNYQLMHVELAGNYGSLSYQGEYLGTFVDQKTGGNVYFQGGYLQSGYFLTGENAGYNKLMGALDYNVKPNSEFFGTGRKKRMGGWGAWQVAARWSWLDLSHQVNPANQTLLGVNPGPQALPVATPPVNPNAGVLNEPTIALNWWWNQYMRVQFNYIYAMQNSVFYGRQNTDIYALRFQTEF